MLQYSWKISNARGRYWYGKMRFIFGIMAIGLMFKVIFSMLENDRDVELSLPIGRDDKKIG